MCEKGGKGSTIYSFLGALKDHKCSTDPKIIHLPIIVEECPRSDKGSNGSYKNSTSLQWSQKHLEP